MKDFLEIFWKFLIELAKTLPGTLMPKPPETFVDVTERCMAIGWTVGFLAPFALYMFFKMKSMATWNKSMRIWLAGAILFFLLGLVVAWILYFSSSATWAPIFLATYVVAPLGLAFVIGMIFVYVPGAARGRLFAPNKDGRGGK